MTTGSFEIVGGDYERGGLASGGLKQRLKRVGVEATLLRRAMIAAYEAEMNVVVHARRGTLHWSLDDERLDVIVADEGPGIPDVPRAMQAGFSTAPAEARQLGFGAGMGLPNIRRNTDQLSIHTVVGRGTEISFTVFLRPQQGEQTAGGHSLAIEVQRCIRCLRCLGACPTQALRLHGGPTVLGHLCVDCTACIAACEPHALLARAPAALPRPELTPLLALPRAFFVQLGRLATPARVMAALRQLGWAEVLLLDGWEAALQQALVERAAAGPERLHISPACPAVVSLIELRFPSLVPALAPYECAAVALWRTLAGARAPDAQSVALVTCPAQRTALRQQGAPEQRVVPPSLLAAAVQPLLRGRAAATALGLPAGQAPFGATPRSPPATPAGLVRVTGIRHVLRLLEALENGQLDGVRLLEPWACDEGCAGSPLYREDPFVVGHRLRGWETGAPTASDTAPEPVAPRPTPGPGPRAVARQRPFSPRPGLRLDPEMGRAMALLAAMDAQTRKLPGRDCAVCGAPSCAALAEDIVVGRALATACPYLEVPR